MDILCYCKEHTRQHSNKASIQNLLFQRIEQFSELQGVDLHSLWLGSSHLFGWHLPSGWLRLSLHFWATRCARGDVITVVRTEPIPIGIGLGIDQSEHWKPETTNNVNSQKSASFNLLVHPAKIIYLSGRNYRWCGNSGSGRTPFADDPGCTCTFNTQTAQCLATASADDLKMFNFKMFLKLFGENP